MDESCKKITSDLRGYALNTLSDRRYQRVARHLDTCAQCRDALEQEKNLLSLLDHLPEVTPPDMLAERTLDRIVLECQADNRTPVSIPGKVNRAIHWRWWPMLATACLLLLVSGSILIGFILQVRYPGWMAWQPIISMESSLFSRGSTHNHLKQWGLILKLYSGENRGKFPPVAPYEGVWAPDLQVLYPYYVNDVSLMVNPKRADAPALLKELEAALTQEPRDWETGARLFAKSYTYTGWLTDNPEQLALLAGERFRMSQADIGQLNADSGDSALQDLDSDYRRNDIFIPRLREGVERFYITDINNPGASSSLMSTIVVMFETLQQPDNRKFPRRYDALYMDGHVSSMLWGDDFPILPEVADILSTQSD